MVRFVLGLIAGGIIGVFAMCLCQGTKDIQSAIFNLRFITIIQKYFKEITMQINRKINGCEITMSFKPQSDNIKDKVLWMLIECFKTRISHNLKNDLSNSSLQGE